jgi:hypothetical protein
LPLPSLIDVSHPENLHWFAVAGSSIVLSLASSVVPNYLETTLDKRSHNRSRLFNETTARVHIAYIIFLVALITSDDVDRSNSKIIWLVTLTIVLVFILFFSIIVSGQTIQRIQKYNDWTGSKHQCRQVNGVCELPIGWWVYCKVCFLNGLLALVVGAFCVWIAVSPLFIKHAQSTSLPNANLPQNQQKDYYRLAEKLYNAHAKQTKFQFEQLFMNNTKDDKLNVSYWFSYNGELHQLSTTEDKTTHKQFHDNDQSIIGCGFANPNYSVQWDRTNNKIEMFPINGDPRARNNSCNFAKEADRTLETIVCTTYNDSENRGNTVGICVFTESKGNVFINDSWDFLTKRTEFLRGRTKEFYESIVDSLNNKELVPQ